MNIMIIYGQPYMNTTIYGQPYMIDVIYGQPYMNTTIYGKPYMIHICSHIQNTMWSYMNTHIRSIICDQPYMITHISSPIYYQPYMNTHIWITIYHHPYIINHMLSALYDCPYMTTHIWLSTYCCSTTYSHVHFKFTQTWRSKKSLSHLYFFMNDYHMYSNNNKKKWTHKVPYTYDNHRTRNTQGPLHIRHGSVLRIVVFTHLFIGRRQQTNDVMSWTTAGSGRSTFFWFRFLLFGLLVICNVLCRLEEIFPVLQEPMEKLTVQSPHIVRKIFHVHQWVFTQHQTNTRRKRPSLEDIWIVMGDVHIWSCLLWKLKKKYGQSLFSSVWVFGRYYLLGYRNLGILTRTNSRPTPW